MIITSCTQKNSIEFYDTPLSKSLDNLEELSPIVPPRRCIYYENKLGMSKRYNETIEMFVSSNHDIAFVHDDVLINDLFFEEKMEEGFKKFDVLGIAGSRNFNIKRRPVCWHNCPPVDRSGGCFHPITDKKDSTFNEVYYTYFGVPNVEVVVLDGLFIAAKHEVFEAGVRWNEKFTFDFYDAAFCLNAIKAGFKIGTIPLAVTHYSHGAGILKPSYLQAEELFIKEYTSR